MRAKDLLANQLHDALEGDDEMSLAASLGDLGFSEHLARYRDHGVIVVIASVGKAGEVQKEKYVCGTCGFALTELGACPRCKMQVEETAKGLKEAFLREVDEFLDGKWEDSEEEGDC